MNKKNVIILIVFIMLHYHASLLIASDSYEVNINDSPLDASQLKATRFTPVLDTKINTGENLIYCSTFQLVWNNLCKDVIKDNDVEIENTPEYIELNNKNISIGTPEDSYIAMSGFVNDGILDKIKNTLNEKFSLPLAFLKNLDNNSIIMYSYFNKKISPQRLTKHFYPSRFANSKNAIETLSNISSLELIYDNGPTESCSILSQYFPTGSIIKINESTNEDIIISTILQDENLLRCYENIENMINDIKNNIMVKNKYGKTPLLSDILKYYCYGSESWSDIKSRVEYDYNSLLRIHTNCSLWLPIIDINITNFSLISSLNKKIKNRHNTKFNYKKHNILDSINIHFSLGKNVFKIDPISSSPCVYTQLVFNKPFIIFLKKKQSKFPYFMAYIGNDELLVKSNVDYEDFWKKYFEDYKRKVNSK